MIPIATAALTATRSWCCFTDLGTGLDAQDAAVPPHNKNGRSGVFTSNEGETLTRWDVQVDIAQGRRQLNSKGKTVSSGDCSVLIYARGGGSASRVTP